MAATVNLAEGEAILGIPIIPIWEEFNIEQDAAAAMRSTRTLASFHPPGCACGRSFGICYDLAAITETGHGVNETLLHELVHAWQYCMDPTGSGPRQIADVERFGYHGSPHEVEARALAAAMHGAGVQVWFPG